VATGDFQTAYVAHVFQLDSTILDNLFTLNSSKFQRESTLFHPINPIRSRPGDNPQSKNRTIFEYLLRPQEEWDLWIPVNAPWTCCVSSLTSSCLSVSDVKRLHRPRPNPQLPVVISGQDHTDQAVPDSQPTEESWLHRASSFGDFSRTHELNNPGMSSFKY